MPMNSQDIQRANNLALGQRFFTRDEYTFRHISPHNKLLHEVKWNYPYLGFVDVRDRRCGTFRVVLQQ